MTTATAALEFVVRANTEDFKKNLVGMAAAVATNIQKINQTFANIEGFKKLQQQIPETEKLLRTAVAKVGWLGEAYNKALSMGDGSQAKWLQRTLEADLKAATRSTDKLSKELDRQNAALKNYESNLTAAGVDVSKLAEQEAGLQQKLKASTHEWAEQSQVIKAFSTIGVRSAHDVGIEIQQLQSAYQHLAQSGRVSTTDLSRAHQQLQQRVQGLRT